MKSSRAKKTAPRAPRRWRTPPPLTRGAEPLEGMELLRELSGEVAILLWQAYRNVMFWGTAEEGERAPLFSPRAAEKRRADLDQANVPRDVSAALYVVAEMLEAPDEIPGEKLANACMDIARWADEEGHGVAALSFTQAAALAAPRDAVLQLAVGQLARRRGEFARAESWFRHAIMIGRQVGDWESYSRAYLALGNMLVRRGNFPAAYRMHIKALRAARRKGMPHIQGEALHDLFVIAIETGRPEQAEEYARQAFRAYGPGHPNLPTLAHDVAYFWMQQGSFERALDVFQAVEAHSRTNIQRIATVASIARAAGGAGERDLFRKAWTQVMRLARDPDVQSMAPVCLLELAYGASSLGEWDRAEQAAGEALETSRRLGQAKVQMQAEGLLDATRNERAVEKSVEVGPPVAKKRQALATDLVRTLDRTPAGAA